MTSLSHFMLKRNVRAFLWALRYGEGTQGPEGYRTLVGGKLFAGPDGKVGTIDDFRDHPRQIVTIRFRNGKSVRSSAAGAYQFLTKTWDGVAAKHGLSDFEPPTQDLAAVALIAGRKALDDVVAGRIEEAVRKCNKEWASLPGSPYGQPVVTMAQFKREYEEAGGLYVDEDAVPVPPPVPPVPEPKLPQRSALRAAPRPTVPVESIQKEQLPPPSPTTTQEPKMVAPLLAALAPVLIPKLVDLVPQLARIFSSGSRTAERNLEALEVVANVAKDAIGAKNEQELIEAIEADPTQATAVKEAIERNYLQIEEAGGGGIEGARKFNLEVAQLRDADGKPVSLWAQPAFIISCIILSLVVMMTFIVMFPWEVWGTTGQIYTDEIRLIVVTAIIGSLSTVGAFWLGSSFATQRADRQQVTVGTRATDAVSMRQTPTL